MTWLWTTIGKWLAAIGAVIIAIGAAAAWAFGKGRKVQAGQDSADEAAQAIERAKAVQDQARTRAEVENETASLPDAPAQPLSTAAPGTAAGQLRTGGWLRGDEKPTVSDHDPS